MRYNVERFSDTWSLEKFLNKNEIPKENIISITGCGSTGSYGITTHYVLLVWIS